MTDATPAPIFVVGPSRGGTALMRSMLNNHADIFITGETHYFDDLRVKLAHAAEAPLEPGRGPAMRGLLPGAAHRPYGHGGIPDQGWLAAEDLHAEAARCGEGADAWFEAFCRLGAAREGKPRWGEKTPRHVYRIPDILARYPEARVIAMLRSPAPSPHPTATGRTKAASTSRRTAATARRLRSRRSEPAASYHIVIQSLCFGAGWPTPPSGHATASARAGSGYSATRISSRTPRAAGDGC